jgi:hypothetical protein
MLTVGIKSREPKRKGNQKGGTQDDNVPCHGAHGAQGYVRLV